MMKRGITLVELLVAIAITTIVAGGTFRAYIVGVDYQMRAEERRVLDDAQVAFELQLRELIQMAYVSDDPDDALTYFIGYGSGGSATDSADQLTFTVQGQRLPTAYTQSIDDFENLNARFGPQGGTAEVSLSLSPVGVTQEQGLFLREQRPADGDPTQGGYERVLNASVRSLRFEFFDGATWVQSWDTDLTERRIPAAVQVWYTLEGEEQERSVIVRLPLSDATPEDPVPTGGIG